MTKKDQLKKIALGAGIAAASGYLVGLLTAPKSGKKTRSDIKKKTVNEISVAEEKLKLLYTEINDLLSLTSNEDKLSKTNDRNSKKYAHVLDQARESRDKLSLILKAIKHNGSSEDEDLDLAIENAEKAIHNAKNFLLKK